MHRKKVLRYRQAGVLHIVWGFGLSRFRNRIFIQPVFFSALEVLTFLRMKKVEALRFLLRSRSLYLRTIRFFWKGRKPHYPAGTVATRIDPETACGAADENTKEALAALRDVCDAVIQKHIDQFGPLSAKDDEIRERALVRKSVPRLQFLRMTGGSDKVTNTTMDNIEDFEAIFKALAHPSLVATARDYLGEDPLISEISLAYTPANDFVLGSQMYHYHGSADNGSPTELGIFMNMTDVDDKNGPFTYFDGVDSKECIETHMRRRIDGSRVTDDMLADIVGMSKQKQHIGEKGAAIFCDGARCIHQGARKIEDHRIILIAFYCSRTQQVTRTPIWRSNNALALNPTTDIEKSLLNVL